MPQRVSYEALPSTRYNQYIFKLRTILTFLEQPGSTKFRTFRDFVRKQGVWDKEKSEAMFSLVDIAWDKKTVSVGKLAKQLAKATVDADAQDLIFQRLMDANILLVKYVIEALDVEAGGRLHSVHELYRMITSYVYPGEHIPLTDFQGWMDWLAASGYVKLVGIRWALSDKGLKILAELKGMDVEEILEDLEAEAEEEAEETGDAVEPEDDDVQDSAPVAVELDDEEDLFDDLPPEPKPPSADALAAASAAFSDEFADVAGTDEALEKVAESKPKRAPRKRITVPVAEPPTSPPVAAGGATLHGPLSMIGWPMVANVSADDATNAALADRITNWHVALGDWPVFTAESLGVVHDPKQGDLTLLIELGVMATLIEGLRPQPQVFAFVKRLKNTTFFATLGHGEGLEEGLDALEKTGQEPWARALFERLVHARFIARRVSMKIDLLPTLKAAKNGREVVNQLREFLLGPHWVEAPFWVARELVRFGVLGKAKKYASAACVPTRRLLANAARIGLIPSAEVHSFDGLLKVSEQVSKLFGASAGYGVALEQLDVALGLTL